MKQIELFASNHETNNEAADFAEYVGEVNNAINVDITVTCTVVDNYSETTEHVGSEIDKRVSSILWEGYCDEDKPEMTANRLVASVVTQAVLWVETPEPEREQRNTTRVDPTTCTLVDVARALVENLPEMADPDAALAGSDAVEVLCSVWPGLLAALERESPRITRSLVHPDLDGRVLVLSNGCCVAQHPDRGDVVTGDIVGALAELSAEPQHVRDSGGRWVNVAPVEEVEKWADSVDADIGRVYP